MFAGRKQFFALEINREKRFREIRAHGNSPGIRPKEPFDSVPASQRDNFDGTSGSLLKKNISQVKRRLEFSVRARPLPTQQYVARMHSGLLRWRVLRDPFYNQALLQLEPSL